MRGVKTMNDYRTKVAGRIVTAAGVVLTIAQKITSFTILPKLSVEKHYYLCIWTVVLGLYMMAFSKEKFEDERVKKIRAGAVQIVILMMSAVLLSLSLVGILHDDLQFDGSSLLFLIGFYMLAYNIIFNIGLRFDNLWNYNTEDVTIKDNFKKNKLKSLNMKQV